MIIVFLLGAAFADLESLYVHEHYHEIISAAPIILFDSTLSQSEIITVNKFYAFSLSVLGKKEEAILVFHRLLDLKPDIAFDPVEVSPKIITVFNEAKVKKLSVMPVIEHVRDTVYIQRSIPLTSVLPGVYQIQKSSKIKGYTLLTAEVVSLACFFVSQYYYYKAHDQYVNETDPERIRESYEEYDGWHKKRLFFISTSTLICLYNIIDVLVFD